MHTPRTLSKRPFLPALLLWVAGVLYGSLIPFDFHARPLGEAFQSFLHAPWIDLGMGGRADWVANLLAFIPLAFLLATVCIPRYGSAIVRGINAAGVVAVCVVIAVAIEFTQVFFPPRTVSLNDMVAESLGSAVGVAIWWFAGDKLAALIKTARGPSRTALHAALACYMLAYLALSLFPYDFLVSREELVAKWASGSHGWLLAPSGCDSHFRCLVKSMAEIVAAAPFGIWLRLIWGGRYSREVVRVFIAGAVLGVMIETAQFLTASGISQGVSVLTRAAGCCLGYYVCYMLQVYGLDKIRPWLRPLIALSILPYLIALALVNGVHPVRWTALPGVWARINEVHFLPFYYYYFTTETRAMVSLLGIAGLYGPIGVAAGAWAAGRMESRPPSVWLVALYGGGLCAVFETLKLFDPARHPDFTDVIIAAAAAAFGLVAFRMLVVWFSSEGITSRRDFSAG